VTDDSMLFDFEPAPDPSDTGLDAPPLDDPGLAAVVTWFRRQGDMQKRFGSILRQALDEVLDGQRTGRFDVEKLEKTEKTYLGTKVEIVTRAVFELPHGGKMDYLVADHDIDSKFSLRGSWSIPTEAMGHLCLLTTAKDRAGTFDVGIIRITPDILNPGRNKDKKTTITKEAKTRIVWLARNAPLPGNLLLSLPDTVVEKIMSAGSGQKKINELLRQVQGHVIERNTAVTVAQQEDGLKRCRDARPQLADEGIVVLGHQNDSPIVAQALGLPKPAKGTFLAVRLVRVASGVDGRSVARIGDGFYAVARAEDPVERAPQLHY
jgi:uncharacterized protein (DUF4415 family)